MTCWGVKDIGESDSAGNCKFPKPSGATILLDPTRSFLFLKTPLRSGHFEAITSHESPTKTFCATKNFAFGRKSKNSAEKRSFFYKKKRARKPAIFASLLGKATTPLFLRV